MESCIYFPVLILIMKFKQIYFSCLVTDWIGTVNTSTNWNAYPATLSKLRVLQCLSYMFSKHTNTLLKKNNQNETSEPTYFFVISTIVIFQATNISINIFKRYSAITLWLTIMNGKWRDIKQIKQQQRKPQQMPIPTTNAENVMPAHHISDLSYLR